MEQRLYLCRHCGSIITKVNDSSVSIVCCGEKRTGIVPGEKPVVCFALCEGDEVEAACACCNLHSLWKA